MHTFTNNKREKEQAPHQLLLVNSLVNTTNTKSKGTEKKRTLKRNFVHWSKINIIKAQETTDQKFFFSSWSLYSSGSNVWPSSGAREAQHWERKEGADSCRPWELTRGQVKVMQGYRHLSQPPRITSLYSRKGKQTMWSQEARFDSQDRTIQENNLGETHTLAKHWAHLQRICLIRRRKINLKNRTEKSEG